jgi:peptidoglycan/LPS O-acetylase OafA/YrhL
MEMGLTNQLAAHFARHDPHKIIRVILIAAFSFVAMGTVTAVWRNPFFTRMTPIEGWELPSLLMFASLAGVFAAIRQPSCSTKKAGFGSIASFLGIACPTCNKVLMFIFGGEALMRWFDPIRPTVTALGLFLLALSIRTEWRKRRLAHLAVPPVGDI